MALPAYADWFSSSVRGLIQAHLSQGESADWFEKTALVGAAGNDFSFLTDAKVQGLKAFAGTVAPDVLSKSDADFAEQVKLYLQKTATSKKVKPATAPVVAPAPPPVAPAPAAAPVAEAPVAGAAPEAEKKSIFDRKFDFNTLAAAVVVAVFVGYVLGSL